MREQLPKPWPDRHAGPFVAALLLMVLVTGLANFILAAEESLTTDLQNGLATAEFVEGRIQWKVLMGLGGETFRFEEELFLDIDGDNLEILCTVENLSDSEVPLRNVRIEIVPPARKTESTNRVAQGAGPGSSRSSAAATNLGLRDLPTPQPESRVARGSRTDTQTQQTGADDNGYKQQLRATQNAGFVSLVEEPGYDQGLRALNIVNPTARGRWLVKISGQADEPFLVVARVTPVEMTGSDTATLIEASQSMVESIEKAMEEIEENERRTAWEDRSDEGEPRVAMGALDRFKCDTCCKCEWTIKLTGIATAINSVCGKKALKEIRKNKEVEDRIKAVLWKVVDAAADIMGLKCGKEVALAFIMKRDLFCMIDNGEKFFCYLIPELAGESPLCGDPCPKPKREEADDDEPILPVDPDLDQDWLTQTGHWRTFDRSLVGAQTFTVGKRGVLRGIELGICQQRGGTDEDLRLQIVRVDKSGRPSQDGQGVILQKWIHPRTFSTRQSAGSAGPGSPGQPGQQGPNSSVGPDETAASIDLRHDEIEVFPGEKLAIIVTHSGSRAFEWIHAAGYEGGQGFTRPIKGGGWADQGSDFSFRTYVIQRASQSVLAEWVPDTRKSHSVWNRTWAAQTFVVPQGGLIEAIELGICRSSNVSDRLRVEIRQVDARGTPDGEAIFSGWCEPTVFPGEGTKELTTIDVRDEKIVVKPGQRLAIAIRNRGGDPYEWWYLDGYADGQGYVEGSSGWMDWKCDFSFRVLVGAP